MVSLITLHIFEVLKSMINSKITCFLKLVGIFTHSPVKGFYYTDFLLSLALGKTNVSNIQFSHVSLVIPSEKKSMYKNIA